MPASPTPQPGSPDPDSIAERLKQQFGDQLSPTLPLQCEPVPDKDAPSRLFEKLRGAGTRGSRYRLLGEVARGGMGVILKIWDDELRRTLAMKVVLGRGEESKGDTPHVDPKTLGRFLEEAQVTGQLDHPGIVPVHELGLGEDGHVYFTMRLVKGEDLRRIFEKVRTGEDGWNEARARGVLLKVCEAMSYAHSKGVIHRDLKPANVMVGKFGEVYVMDWGLARVLGREDRHDLRLKPQPSSSYSAVKTDRREDREETASSPLVTMDGDIIGTPSFMPPEQAKGQLDLLGPHSDVYAVGAMLYTLVAGEMPYVPCDARVSARTVLVSVLNGPPKSLFELAPKTPAELIAIVEKAMERDVARRYPNMGELADDLRAFGEGGIVRAYLSSPVRKIRSYWRRQPAQTRIGLVAGYVLAPVLFAGCIYIGEGPWHVFPKLLIGILILSALLIFAGLFVPRKPRVLGACALFLPCAFCLFAFAASRALERQNNTWMAVPEWRTAAEAEVRAGCYADALTQMGAAPLGDRREQDQIALARLLRGAGRLDLALLAMDENWIPLGLERTWLRSSFDFTPFTKWRALILLELEQPDEARDLLREDLDRPER